MNRNRPRVIPSLALALLLTGCLTPQGGEGPPVDFAYSLEGRDHRLAELRRRPVVLVLIRTSEAASQLYLPEVVKAFKSRAGEVRFLMLSLEEGERPLVAMFAEFNELPFPVGVAEPAVALGQTALGVIPLVPSTYLIDETGRVADVGAGVLPAATLERAIDRQLRSGW